MTRLTSYVASLAVAVCVSGATLPTTLEAAQVPPSGLRIVPRRPAPAPRVELPEGTVVKETTPSAVYVIHDGKRIHIPTPDALFAMGYDWSQVRILADGALANYPIVQILSSSATPGSLVYPPNHIKWFPVRGIPGATRIVSRQKEIQHVELYGWLRLVDAGCGDGSDFQYELEVDTEWALARGIDLHRLLRVGNIANHRVAQMLDGFSPRRAVSVPLIKVELNAWGRQEGDGTPLPEGWVQGNCELMFPFDPYRAAPGGQPLAPAEYLFDQRGPYVRVAGSLVTDDPHDDEAVVPSWFSRVFAFTRNRDDEWRGSVPDWDSREPSHPDHPARWTELHPIDFLEVIGDRLSRVTTRGVALVARTGALPFGLSNACESVSFDLAPEASRPTGWRLAYQEHRGPETLWPWGQDKNNGSWVTAYDDRISVKARVCGGGLGGSTGRFKAIYRVWWVPAPDTPQVHTSVFRTGDGDCIRYTVQPAVVGAALVQIQLCQAATLSWEKRLYVGNHAALVVRDARRCATTSIAAALADPALTLTYHKAKAFGVVRPIHQVPLSTFLPIPPGSRLRFDWLSD